MFDYIVVGAGIAGAGLADALSAHGRVAMIEAEESPGRHATSRSAALFAASYGSPVFRALTRASASFFEQPPVGFCDHPLLTDRGSLYIAREDQLPALHATYATLRATDDHVRLIDPDEAIALLPLLSRSYLAGAILDGSARDIEVDALLQGFLRSGKRRGVELFTATRIASPIRRKGNWHVSVADTEICAPILINAAGAWADEVATACGAQALGMKALRRTAALVDPPREVSVGSWPMLIDIDEQFYAKPDAGKILISPADEEPSPACDAYADDLSVAIGIDRVQAALEIEVTRVTHSWAGLRTFAPDRDPVIGFDPDVEGFFWCAGQGGYGIQSAPAVSAAAAALARGEPIPAAIKAQGVEANAISPARFGRKTGAAAHGG